VAAQTKPEKVPLPITASIVQCEFVISVFDKVLTYGALHAEGLLHLLHCPQRRLWSKDVDQSTTSKRHDKAKCTCRVFGRSRADLC
jgi:hypothetical protein